METSLRLSEQAFLELWHKVNQRHHIVNADGSFIKFGNIIIGISRFDYKGDAAKLGLNNVGNTP